MAITYAAFPVVGGLTPTYVGYFREIRDAIDRRAAQIGATVTLPDPIVAGDDVYSHFGPWLKKCRTAIQDLLAEAKYGRMMPGAAWGSMFQTWTKANLITYIQNRGWVLNTRSAWEDWMYYLYDDDGYLIDTPLYAGYINEIYYALELLCMTQHYIAPAAVTSDGKSGTSTGEADATDAYDAAKADYDGKAWTVGANLYASGIATVYYEPTPETYAAYVGGAQVTEWTLTIPNLSYPITRILVMWEDYRTPTVCPYIYPRATAYNAANYGGAIGQWLHDNYSLAPAAYRGYKYWSGLSWNNEARSFSHKWGDTDPFMWQYNARGTTYDYRTEQSYPAGTSVFYTAFSGYLNEAWAPWTNDSWDLEPE